MTKKKSGSKSVTEQESRLLDGLRKHPLILARVQSILEIAGSQDGPLKTADEVEELLIEEMRRLGNATMNEWATQAEERISTELKSQDHSLLSRKKKH